MNGRVYDPVTGRFIQADPFVQEAKNSQNLNRYTYVLNNPMGYTDPSGYLFSDLKPFASVIASIVVGYYMGPWAANFFNSAIVGGAVTGFVAGGIATGSSKGAWSGAISGAMFGAISSWADYMDYQNFTDIVVNGNSNLLSQLKEYGGNFLTSGQIASVMGAHAVVGGVMADLQGGKFSHGFISAGFTKVMMHNFVTNQTSFSNAVKSAIVAGTASAISGGKFANGAITGTFQYSLNWATKAHNHLIKKAYGGELNDIEIAAMEAGSRYSDRQEAQGADKSYMHSMTSDEVSLDEMIKERDTFIKERMKAGKDAFDGTLAGNVTGYFRIGEGLHTVMDQYSPAHVGSNQHWNWTQIPKHGPLPTSLEGIRTVTHPQHQHIVDKMRAVWQPN